MYFLLIFHPRSWLIVGTWGSHRRNIQFVHARISFLCAKNGSNPRDEKLVIDSFIVNEDVCWTFTALLSTHCLSVLGLSKCAEACRHALRAHASALLQYIIRVISNLLLLFWKDFTAIKMSEAKYIWSDKRKCTEISVCYIPELVQEGDTHAPAYSVVFGSQRIWARCQVACRFKKFSSKTSILILFLTIYPDCLRGPFNHLDGTRASTVSSRPVSAAACNLLQSYVRIL